MLYLSRPFWYRAGLPNMPLTGRHVGNLAGMNLNLLSDIRITGSLPCDAGGATSLDIFLLGSGIPAAPAQAFTVLSPRPRQLESKSAPHLLISPCYRWPGYRSAHELHGGDSYLTVVRLEHQSLLQVCKG